MLEVVQYHEQLPANEAGHDLMLERFPHLRGNAERSSNGRQHQFGLTQGCQIHEPNAVVERASRFISCRHREPCFCPSRLAQ